MCSIDPSCSAISGPIDFKFGTLVHNYLLNLSDKYKFVQGININLDSLIVMGLNTKGDIQICNNAKKFLQLTLTYQHRTPNHCRVQNRCVA